jgi:hypothetical protein
MPKTRIRLEVATATGREPLETIDTITVPRVGERIDTKARGAFEVVEVVHTPLIREWDAVVIVKAAKVVVASASLSLRREISGLAT